VPDPYLDSVLKAIASAALDTESPRLITVDELRAAGALDVPVAWRKSLGAQRDLFTDLFEDDDAHPEEQQPTRIDPDDEVSADEPL
jgi:hypothetical protein